MRKRILLSMYDWLFKSKYTFYSTQDEYENAKQYESQIKYSFKWWLRILFKVSILIIILILSFILFGCSHKQPQVVYKYVSVPVKCDVVIPSKPQYTGDIIKDNINILKYSDILLLNLKKCK